MRPLRYLIVLGTLITIGAFGTDILAPYLGPLEYKGHMGYSYPEGTNHITRITIEIDSTLAEKLIILNTPNEWSYTLTGDVLELEGGTLSPGNSIEIPVSFRGYIAPNEYAITSTGYTSGGEVVQASGSLVVNFMLLLYTLDIASAMRYQLAMATMGLGFIELIISRMLQGKPKEVESVVDKLQPYSFGEAPEKPKPTPKVTPNYDHARAQDLKNLVQSQEPYFADNISYTDIDHDLSFVERRARADGKDVPLTDEMLEKKASELESKQGSILDTVEKPDLKIDQGVAITSDGELIQISDDTEMRVRTRERTPTKEIHDNDSMKVNSDTPELDVRALDKTEPQSHQPDSARAKKKDN